MKKSVVLLALAVTIAITSCQKEYTAVTNNGTAANSVTGNWKFVSLTSTTESTAEYDFFGTSEKSITKTDYTTTNNSGTVVFDDSTMQVENLTYSVSTTTNTYIYENGVLTDSLSTPFEFTLPVTNSAGHYQLIGTDSIYFAGGGLISISGSSGVETTASGGKININGDLLTITQAIVKDTIQNVSGIMMHLTATGNATILLQKQ